MATILIVDDDGNTRKLYASLLSPLGHTVLEAQDGRDGLKLTQEREPDLIISDILMPSMNGYDFVSAVRRLSTHRETPVIFQSASFLDSESRALGTKCGVSDYISKPCEPEKILETVNLALGLPEAAAPITTHAVHADPVSLLVDAFYEKGQQLDSVSSRLKAVVEFGIQISQAQTLETLLETALNAARKIIGANYAGSAVLAEKGESGAAVLFSYFRVIGGDTTTSVRLVPQKTPGTFLKLLSESRAVRYLSVDGKPCVLDLAEGHPAVHSFLGMAVRTNERDYGIIYVADKLSGTQFSKEDEAFLATIAARCAIGCENLMREQKLKKQMLVLENEIAHRREAQDRFHLLVENSPLGIILCDSQGKISEANPQLQRMFGYTKEELIGKSVELLVPEPLRHLHSGHRVDYMKAPLSRPMGMGMELYARRKDGTAFPVEISLGPLTGAEGQMISGTIVDITERKQLEEQLRISQRMEAVGVLAAGIAHDFNNILPAISGNAAMAISEIAPGDPVKENLEQIRKAAARATSLVRQILTFSRQDAPRRKPLDILSVTSEAVSLVRAGLRGWSMHPDLLGKPDFYFPRPRLAIFVDGCFWHGCKKCGHVPRTRSEFWRAKLERNQQRDRRVVKRLRSQGVQVIRIWEHRLNTPALVCDVLTNIQQMLKSKGFEQLQTGFRLQSAKDVPPGQQVFFSEETELL